jgi:excisionase family DNA binding protein
MRTRSTSIKPGDSITVRIPEAADLLGVGRTKIYALINAGEIEAVKVGGSTLVVVRSIQALVERQRVASRPI